MRVIVVVVAIPLAIGRSFLADGHVVVLVVVLIFFCRLLLDALVIVVMRHLLLSCQLLLDELGLKLDFFFSNLTYILKVKLKFALLLHVITSRKCTFPPLPDLSSKRSGCGIRQKMTTFPLTCCCKKGELAANWLRKAEFSGKTGDGWSRGLVKRPLLPGWDRGEGWERS